MIVFADTSALFALLVSDDYMHARARANFAHFIEILSNPAVRGNGTGCAFG